LFEIQSSAAYFRRYAHKGDVEMPNLNLENEIMKKTPSDKYFTKIEKDKLIQLVYLLEKEKGLGSALSALWEEQKKLVLF